MAMSCRLFSRQLNPSLQFQVFKHSYRHLGEGTGQSILSKKLLQSISPLQLCSRQFRSRKPKLIPNQSGGSFSFGKSALFTAGVCSCSFLGAMVWNYENVRQVYKEMAAESTSPRHHRFIHEKVFGFRNHLNAIWNGMDQSTKLTFGIIAVNSAVWLLWKVPRFQLKMMRYFSSAAAHPRVSMVFSSFSHISFFHLAINMYVLLSFAPIAAKTFGHEQFSAFYISAGTMSAFASIVCQKVLKRPLAVSVGASGAIMGLLGVTGVVYPNAQLQVAFVSEIFPHSFSADSGVKAIVLFDLLGLLMGWKVLDHAGHLGGMLFGILYAKYGSKYVWGQRDSVVKVWHQLRGKP